MSNDYGVDGALTHVTLWPPNLAVGTWVPLQALLVERSEIAEAMRGTPTLIPSPQRRPQVNPALLKLLARDSYVVRAIHRHPDGVDRHRVTGPLTIDPPGPSCPRASLRLAPTSHASIGKAIPEEPRDEPGPP